MKKPQLLIVIAAFSLIFLVPTVAAPKFQLETRSTWDADMINSPDTGNTGEGVYVAVLDTGLAPNWKDYFPADRIAAHLGKGFKEDLKWNAKTQSFEESGVVHEVSWMGDIGSTHGTHVTSTIIGYNYYAPADALSGLPLNPLFIDGIASDATIIPIKVLADYTIGRSKTDPVDYPFQRFVMGTDRAVAAGIRYATDLKIAGYSPMIITMSLGGPAPAQVMEEAIDYAIANGVIVVASAGNEGEDGMGWPGAYPQVISVGACGWKYEWYWPEYQAPTAGRYRLWWLQDETHDFNDVDDINVVDEVYITEWSSRELPPDPEHPELDQDLDVVAPGSWVRGPYPGYPGYSHLPWWSAGFGWLMGRNPGNFYYLGGTSMSAPHVTGVVAQMLEKAREKDVTLAQADVEYILENTALNINPGSMAIWDLDAQGIAVQVVYEWNSDATGSGLVQANLALNEIT